MTVQPGVECDIVYAVESTIGTAASGGGTSQKLRKVQSSLNPAKAPFQSQEFASHQQIADLRHGMRSVSGSVDGELSPETYDDWIEAAMRGTWATGVNSGSISVSADNATSKFSRASGSWITDGFKVGDIVRPTGFATTGAANNSLNWRITALTAADMTVANLDGTTAVASVSAAAGVTITVQGKKLIMGTTKRSYTIEHVFPTVDESERFDGCRIGGFNVRVPPNGMATISFPILGMKYNRIQTASSPYFSSPTSETTTNILAGPAGIVRVNGADTLVATAWEVAVNGNLSNQPVIGSNFAPDIFHGRNVVTGSFSAYMESLAYAEAFLNETEIDVLMNLYTVDATPASFLNFRAHRVKLMGMQKTITPDGGLIVTYPWQALRKVGGTGTTSDTSTLVIQRSNT